MATKAEVKCASIHVPLTKMNAFVAVFLASDERMIMEGMKHWEDQTCLRFHPRVEEKNYIHFLAGKFGLDLCIH